MLVERSFESGVRATRAKVENLPVEANPQYKKDYIAVKRAFVGLAGW